MNEKYTIKEFNINLEDIKESNNLFDNLHEAIEKMKLHTLSDRFEVVLNNNLIESKKKLTNFRTILGCRISYDNLDKNISFIVREDNKPSYEELEQENKRLKIQVSAREEVANKYKKIIDETRKIINIEKEKMGYAIYDSCLLLIENKINELKGVDEE